MLNFHIMHDPMPINKEVAKEPPMDLLVWKLIRPFRLAWHGSNKAVSLSFNQCRSVSLPVMF